MKLCLILILCFFPLKLTYAVEATSPTAPEQSPVFALSSYYSYSDSEIQPLKSLSSDFKMSKEELEKWDKEIHELFRSKPLPEAGNYRLYAYLYTAQRDAAAISMEVRGDFFGSLDILSNQIIRLFYPQFSPSFTLKEDIFSKTLALIVFPKYSARFEQEQKRLEKETHLLSFKFWSGHRTTYGNSIRFWEPWQIPPVDSDISLKVPPPPATDWEQQLNIVRQARGSATDREEKAALFWGKAGGSETGDWIWLANDYLFSHTTSLPKIFLVRSVLAMALSDTLITTYQEKFAYKISPPYIADRKISPIVAEHPAPSYPSAVSSYPSTVSAISAAAAGILTYFFPENRAQWEQYAKEAGESRIWNGTNYPIDDAAGKDIGEKVNSYYLNKKP